MVKEAKKWRTSFMDGLDALNEDAAAGGRACMLKLGALMIVRAGQVF